MNETAMRDKIATLILGADTYDSYGCKLCTKSDDYCEVCSALKIADNLIAKGFILPPCKVGDKIYYPYEYGNKVLEKKVRRIIVDDDMWLDVGVSFLPFENVGKTVFLNKEEAEKALKEKEDGNILQCTDK